MLDKAILNHLKSLNISELRELKQYIDSLLPPAVVYQHKPAKCGCNKCKEGGPGHGQYWYAYFTYHNKTHCIYVGKERREIDPLQELEKKKNRKKGGKK
jgi:hypothetical protein